MSQMHMGEPRGSSSVWGVWGASRRTAAEEEGQAARTASAKALGWLCVQCGWRGERWELGWERWEGAGPAGLCGPRPSTRCLDFILSHGKPPGDSCGGMTQPDFPLAVCGSWRGRTGSGRERRHLQARLPGPQQRKRGRVGLQRDCGRTSVEGPSSCWVGWRAVPGTELGPGEGTRRRPGTAAVYILFPGDAGWTPPSLRPTTSQTSAFSSGPSLAPSFPGQGGPTPSDHELREARNSTGTAWHVE